MSREANPRDRALGLVIAFVVSIALWALILSVACPTGGA